MPCLSPWRIATWYGRQHGMKRRTAANFVENDAVLDALCAIGVDYVQGYGVPKPVSMDTGRWRAVA